MMDATQTRREADRQIRELLKVSTWAERKRIRAARQQGREWRRQLAALECEIGLRRGNAGQCPVVNDGTIGIYEA